MKRQKKSWIEDLIANCKHITVSNRIANTHDVITMPQQLFSTQ